MGKDIKVKSTDKKPKVLDTAVRAPRVVKKKTTQVNDIAQKQGENDDNYAENTAEQKSKDIAHKGKDVAGKGVNKGARKITDNVTGKSRGGNSSFSSGRNASAKTARTAKNASQSASRTVKNTVNTGSKNVAKGTIKTANHSVKTATKGSVKSVKTAAKTGKVAIKTTAQTAKYSAKAAQTASRLAVQAAKLAAKAVAVAVKTAVKAAVATAKATAAAVKGLIVFIAAGGWVVIVAILLMMVLMWLFTGVFGVATANETPEGDKPMTEAIEQITLDYENAIIGEIAPHKWGKDEVYIDYGDAQGDSDIPMNWNDTLAIYSVIVTLGETPTTTAVLTPENQKQLEDVFYTMHNFTCTATESTGTDEDGNEISIVHIDVDFTVMDAQTAAEHYVFDDNQYEMLSVMTDPFMMTVYADLLGVDIYGGATSGDISNIISNLPPNEKSSIIVEAALGKLGTAYSAMDCSDLSAYAYAQAGIDLPGTAAAQAKYCYENGFNVGKDELQPGDLIFWTNPARESTRWNKIHHVGIYVGDGMIVDASSSKGRIVYREIWGEYGKEWQIHSYARPT